MSQIKSQYEEVRVPFNKMSFTPDVPSTNLNANEYNDGLNVESDVRGIRSVAGDVFIGQPINPPDSISCRYIYVTGGFDDNGQFNYFVAAIVKYSDGSSKNKWFIIYPNFGHFDITPKGLSSTVYTLNTNITEVWNGTVVIFNDTINPPFFYPGNGDFMYSYSNTPSNTITTIDAITYPGFMYIVVQPKYDSHYIPYATYDDIVISNVNEVFNGTYEVQEVDNTSVNSTTIIVLSPSGFGTPTYPSTAIGTGIVSPKYVWNYNSNWASYTANFLRMYSTPNVGSILVAGNLTVQTLTDTTEVYPVTIQWSQAFGLNQVPLSWEPTILNVANQLEVPLRGPALDAFPSNGMFFLCSYWDTVVFSPLNYSTTSTPILGVRIYNQGRGLLSSNCWSNTDQNVYGLDARDVWVFDGTNFTGIGNQRVKNWLFDQLNPTYYNMVYMECNTQKNQIEIYYPDSTATDGVPNKMLSYRYDLDIWNAPREVSYAISACESPIWVSSDSLPYYTFQLSSRCITYAGYASSLIQKDIGYRHCDETPIHSYFRRDNIKLLPNYSGKLMVHRLLPEIVNLGAVPFTGTNNIQITPSTGNISIKIEGSDSVGSSPNETTDIVMNLDTSNPWCQVDQNTHRVNSLIIENTSYTDVWLCSATTWQYTQTEDDR